MVNNPYNALLKYQAICFRLLLFILLSATFSPRLIAQPIVQSFTPVTAAAGSQVTINGTQFSATPSANTVYFGATKALVNSASATSLVVTVPKGANYSPISVTVNGLSAYSSLPFIPVFTGGLSIDNNSFVYNQGLINDNYPRRVSFADLDGDGKADVLALKYLPSTSELSYVWSYLNTSTPGNVNLTFEEARMTGVISTDMATADFDGDGKIDLVTTNNVAKEIAFFRNTSTVGTISFAGATTSTVEALNYIAVGDIDGDGKIDIIGTNSVSSNATILRNQSTPGNISFVRITPFSVGLNPGMIVLSDLNGDNKPDLAVANELLNSFSLIRNTSTTGSFSFASAVSVATPDNQEAHYIAAGDLDRDGKNDLLFTTANNLGTIGNSYAFRNTGTIGGAISFSNGGILPNGGLTNNGFCPAISDVNGDGKPDIILGKSGSPFVFQVLQNQSTAGAFSFNVAGSFSSHSAYSIATGDLDGDGKPEIASANFTGSLVDIYKNRCGQLAIASISATTAGTGDTVTISGSNLTGIIAVRFGGTAAASFSVVSANQLKAVIGAGESGSIVITGSTGADSIPGFVFDNGPKIDSFKPAMALAKDTILIKGSRFLTTSSVTFGDVPATWFSVKDARTIVAIPGNGNTGAVKVTTSFGVAVANTIFTLLRKPVITSFSPTSAYTGQYIYVIGQYLTTPGYLPDITLGGVPIQVLEVNGNQTVAYGIVGNGASGSVKVSTFGVADSLAGFTYIPPPLIKSFSPASAHPADTVSIIGAHFLETSSVSFGDSAAGSFTIINDTLIKAIVGHGSTGSLTVEKTSGKSIKAGFTFLPLPAPVIQSFTPLQAISGSSITITGQNLWGVIAVKIGNTQVKLYQQVTTKQLNIIVPVDAAGAISVTTYYGSFTLPSPLFTRIAPAGITSISPLNAIPGTTMTISGQGFGTNPSLVKVHFGAVPATVNSVQDNLINVTIPSFVSYGPISVTVNGLTTFTSQRFTPVNPAISYLNFNAKSFIEVSQGEDLYPTQGTIVHPIDINGDQKPDFITLSLYGSVNYYINTSTPGKPSWRYSHSQPNVAYLENAQEGDIDGDGKIDLLIYAQGPSRLILRNTSTIDSCSFVPEPHAFGEFGLLFDINNDGKPDITRPDPVSFQPQFFINNSIPGKISFKDTLNNIGDQSTLENWDIVLITDIDRDGLPDLIGRRYQQTLIFRNIGTRQIPSFGTPVIMNSPYNPIKAVTADMNGDGIQDLFILYADGTFSVYQNASTAGNILLKSQQLITNDRSRGFNTFATADFNGDNRLDILTQSDYNYFIYQNNSTADSIIIKDTSTYFSNNFWAGCVADIDGDNKQDIVTSTSDLYVLRNRMNESQSTKICPGSNINLPAGITGSNYQWQMDIGSGFTNISNDVNFSNTTGAVLNISNTPSNWLKRQFRCKINNSFYSEPFFLEFESTWISYTDRSWNLGSNWSCGVVPDGNTTVTIDNGRIVEVNADASCRSLQVYPYANFTVKADVKFTVTNK